MRERTKLTVRIVSLLLIILGLIFGVTWNNDGTCIGDEIWSVFGMSPWSNGSNGTHYPGIIGCFVILAGITSFNLTVQEKTRFWIWTGVILILILRRHYLTPSTYPSPI